jgi:hypothetical protein
MVEVLAYSDPASATVRLLRQDRSDMRATNLNATVALADTTGPHAGTHTWADTAPGSYVRLVRDPPGGGFSAEGSPAIGPLELVVSEVTADSIHGALTVSLKDGNGTTRTLVVSF